MAKPKDQHRINDLITATEVRVVDQDGEQAGILSLADALAKAEAAELDLVEIAPNSDPPVCRLMDYGKFRFEQSKKAQSSRKKQKQTHIKEVKFRPTTDEGDYKVKLRNINRFIEDGDKAKITMRFRGRELAHQPLGLKLLERVEADLSDIATVEQRPKLEGRQMVMLLAPKKKGTK